MGRKMEGCRFRKVQNVIFPEAGAKIMNNFRRLMNRVSLSLISLTNHPYSYISWIFSTFFYSASLHEKSSLQKKVAPMAIGEKSYPDSHRELQPILLFLRKKIF